MRKRRPLVWALASAILAAVAVVALAGARSPARVAPALPHELLAGPPVTLSGLQRGAGRHGVLVVFWASWCGPCAREAPAIERFATSPQGRGRLVGVDWSDGLAGARAFIHRYRWTFSNLRDGEGLVGNAYHLTGLPSTFVLSGTGRILSVLRGPQDVASLGRALKFAA
jgi:thiol-disulfide isomerase/thioredoxin